MWDVTIDFDDGSSPTVIYDDLTDTANIISYFYTSSGLHNVSVQVVNEHGDVIIDTVDITTP